MPEVPVYDGSGAAGQPVTLNDEVFGVAPNIPLLHQAVVRQLANARQGTHDTRTRGEVAGSTKKVWRQKGTGRARQGGKRAPHWRGGGIVFGPHPRSYRQALPKKMRAGAMRSALAAKAAAGQIVILQELALDAPSTKTLARLLARVAPGRSTLLVLDGPQPAVQRSARNLPHVTALTTDSINVVDLLRHERLVLSLAAARRLEERYTRRPGPAAEGTAPAPPEPPDAPANQGAAPRAPDAEPPAADGRALAGAEGAEAAEAVEGAEEERQ
jgi:large subunit ribosomal protein L4